MPRGNPGVVVTFRMSEDQNKCVSEVAEAKKMTRSLNLKQSWLMANGAEIIACRGPDVHAQWLAESSVNQTCDNCANDCANEKNFCFKWKAKDDQP
jgi:hypothetical protein